MHDLTCTLVAISTPPGRGGIGCVRLSGAESGRIARALFQSRRGQPRPGGPPCFGRFLDRDGQPLDHGYLVLFPDHASYTGEATAEAWTHGSPAVLAELVRAAVEVGAVLAGPGELTYRAVRNGRIDLTRAEAVRDLIAARTAYQARVALAQAEGTVAHRLAPLRETLEEWIARGEAAVEFVDESETHLPPGTLSAAIDGAIEQCRSLLAGFRTGRVVREGARLVIVGLPNAGKSSLFNRLLAVERAIVTEIPGTTRDTLEEELDLDGIPVRLVDTAGLRDSPDRVESEGVRRALQARADADLVLLVLDGSRPLEPEESRALAEARSDPEQARTVVVVNKSDLEPRIGSLPGTEPLHVSARTGEGLEGLRAELRERLMGPGEAEDPIVTNERHARALEQAVEALARASDASATGFSEELVLEDMREAMRWIGTITGEFTTDDLYDAIFSRFCIGK